MAATFATAPHPAARAVDREGIPRRRGRPEDALPVGARVASWRVEGELGRGGMACVHAVVHVRLGRQAALKLAHHEIIGDQLSAQTFLREARVAQAISHPGVIDVFATGTCEGRPYLVMERLAGMTLGRRVEQGPPLPRGEAIEILLELCDILRASHAAGVVHRDLKLDNVFLCDAPYREHRRVKLLDWGVAHVVGEDDPFSGMIAGTLTYVAPEQILGNAVSGAADFYSLAVLAYYLLCRRPPFAAGNELALLQLHLRGNPPAPSLAWESIPHALEQLLLRMLAKKPEDRPTIDDIEDVLRRSLVGLEPRPRLAAGSQMGLTPVREQGVEREGDPNASAFRRFLPAPPFALAWALFAGGVVALASLIAALP